VISKCHTGNGYGYREGVDTSADKYNSHTKKMERLPKTVANRNGTQAPEHRQGAPVPDNATVATTNSQDRDPLRPERTGNNWKLAPQQVLVIFAVSGESAAFPIQNVERIAPMARLARPNPAGRGTASSS
jgi:hypothetical protein